MLSSIAPGVSQRIKEERYRNYTPGQYAAAALLLLDSAHHAVNEQVMAAHLNAFVTPKKPEDKDQEMRKTGQSLLNTLLYQKVLTLRSYSAMAYDVPREAFFSDAAMGTE